MPRISIFGSTGSIGTQTAAVLQAHGLAAETLVAGNNWRLAVKQASQLRARRLVLASSAAAKKAEAISSCPVFFGEKHILAAASKKGFFMSALPGIVGAAPTIAMLKAGSTVALANKETLVFEGEKAMRLCKKTGATLRPVDSEHAATAQLLRGASLADVHTLTLTASGGALRNWPLKKLSSATAKQVLQHPSWNMGSIITCHSATLVNKAFEIIEASHLFGLPLSAITAVVHPESLVHALVQLKDGSTLAQLAKPDMRLAITQAITGKYNFPVLQPVSLTRQPLTFSAITKARSPLFFEILAAAKTSKRQLSAAALAAECAAQLFMEGRLSFTQQLSYVRRMRKKAATSTVALSRIISHSS